MNLAFLVAGILSGATCLLHTFAGGAHVARPLLTTNGLPDMPKFVLYFCWHMVTIILAATTIAFLYGAVQPGSLALTWFVSGLCAAFAILGIGLAPAKGMPYRIMPQGWLFLPIAFFGFIGSFS